MKVLCNLYPVGAGSRGTDYRTGVFRVVDHLVRGLAVAPECESFFHPVGNIWPSWNYYQEHLRGQRSHFAIPPGRLRASRHLVPAWDFIAATAKNRSLPLRAGRFIAARYVRLGDRMLGAVDDALLREMDVYHSPFLPIAARMKRYRRMVRFTTVYDLIALSHPQFFDDTIIRMIRQLVDGLAEEDYVVCISQATRVALLERAPQLDAARVFVTPLAAGPAFYPEPDQAKIAAIRAQVGLAPDAPYFLSLCTLEPRKNLDTIIRAFARLKQDGQIGDETQLVLVGNTGWKTERIFSALEEARACRDSIILTGFVPDRDLAALYSGALAFIYMSWMEGFGLPPLEAMQCGVPVICSNTSSLPEVVGDAGILLAPDDLDGTVNAMHSLASDPARRAELTVRALERARLFSWEQFIARTLDAYRTALAHR